MVKLGYRIKEKVSLEKAQVSGENVDMAASMGKIMSKELD